MKVRATSEYVKRNLKDAELDRIPQIGEEFEVTKERFDFLNGGNPYKAIFVESIEEANVVTEKENTEEVEVAVKAENTEKAVKKITKKAK